MAELKLPPNTPPAHRAWLERYEDETGFDPLWLEELDGTNATFASVAKRNCRWYEDHTADVYLRISDGIRDSACNAGVQTTDGAKR